MKIRPATHADDVVAIWREVYRADYVKLLPDGVELPFEPRGQCYVAEIDKVAAAFIYVDMQWLDELWVRKQFQGSGIGTALIRHAETVMQAASFSRAYLSVLKANVRAVALYERLGWTAAKSFQDRRSGVWNVKMQKQFSG
jgi:GNAT superfamily N-acetyltransferase